MRSLTVVISVVLGSILLPQPQAFCQTVQGRVVEPGGETISGAVISLRGETGELAVRVVSNDAGLFRIERIDPGRYAVVVERLGYQTTRTALALVRGDSIEVELHMEVEAIPMEPITVTASPRPVWEHTEPPALWEFWERKDHYGKLGFGHFYTYEDMKPLQGIPVALAITQLAPFLYPVANDERRNAYHIQGRIGCPPLIFLDGHPLERAPSRLGMRMTSDFKGKEASVGPLIDDWISLSQIEAVEVYRGASDVPGEFSLTGSMCGAVVIWSQRGPRR